MALSSVSHALSKKLSPEIVQTVLSMVEGFALQGVDKAIWRGILVNWQDREPWRTRGLNPASVRKESSAGTAGWGLLPGPRAVDGRGAALSPTVSVCVHPSTRGF